MKSIAEIVKQTEFSDADIVRLLGITDSVEALSLQNINVYLQENGDFLCQSIDKQGHPISFIQSLGV